MQHLVFFRSVPFRPDLEIDLRQRTLLIWRWILQSELLHFNDAFRSQNEWIKQQPSA